jgi:hypothetical protein
MGNSQTSKQGPDVIIYVACEESQMPNAYHALHEIEQDGWKVMDVNKATTTVNCKVLVVVGKPKGSFTPDIHYNKVWFGSNRPPTRYSNYTAVTRERELKEHVSKLAYSQYSHFN